MKYFCPCCNTEINHFSPGGAEFQLIKELEIIGMGRREYRHCIKCSATDRERLIYIYIRDFILLNSFKNTKILHIAPEIMLSSILNRNNMIEYIKADKFEEGYFYPDTIEIDIKKTIYPDNKFDFIICNHVLEHIEDDMSAIRELFRILKPGGSTILQVPISEKLEKTYENPEANTKELRIKYFGQRNHVRIYARDYLDRLRSAGFYVELIDLSTIYGIEFMNRHGLNPKEKIILCRKN